jgi:hypothetical protein
VWKFEKAKVLKAIQNGKLLININEMKTTKNESENQGYW